MPGKNMTDLKKHGIIARVLIIAVVIFVVVEIVFITIISFSAGRQIDATQSGIYSQKIMYVMNIIDNRHQRLELTANTPLYEEVFKESAIREILNSLVENEDPKVNFFIFNSNGRLVRTEDIANTGTDYQSLLNDIEMSSDNKTGAAREIKSLMVDGVKSWVINSYFEPWDWHLYYVMPLSVKYAGLNELRLSILFFGTIMFLAILSLIVLLLIGNLKPLLRLTKQAINMAAGDLETPINTGGVKEIQLLSLSFESLRVSMRDKIERLKEEIAVRENSQSEMNRILEELKLSNEDLQQFAYASSHDLKEPLRNISNAAAMFEKKFGKNLPAEASFYLEDIIDNISRMELLIKGILEYSLSGKAAVSASAVSVKDVIDEIRGILANSYSKKFVIKIETPLPELFVERTALMRIFTNIINNGIKYNNSNTAEIRIGCILQNGKRLFYIADNGIGINKEYWHKIFDVFRRLHSSFEYEGSGIGLAICKKIIERLGGKIWVESEGEPGKGSTFYFRL